MATAAKPATPAKPKPERKTRDAGVHLAYQPTGPNAVQDTAIIFTARIDALEHAIRQTPPMRVCRWGYGQTMRDAIEADMAETAPPTAPVASFRIPTEASPSIVEHP